MSVDEKSVNEKSVDEKSVDDLSVDGLSPHQKLVKCIRYNKCITKVLN